MLLFYNKTILNKSCTVFLINYIIINKNKRIKTKYKYIDF